MIKIIHCADLHLDSPFSASTLQRAKNKRELLRGTFTSLILYAQMEKADIMLLPGDIFDSEYVSRQTVSLLVSQFEKVPECRFVISPGNHDPYKSGSPYMHEKFPSNVYIFSSPLLSKFSFDDINTDVYGFAFTSEAMETNPFSSKRPEDESRINILSCHGDNTSSGSKYCPINVSDIESSGFDYVALGHIHNSDGVHKAGETYYAYSGCPEGRGWDECGEKTVINLKCEKTAGVFRPYFSFKSLTDRRYEQAQVNVGGCTSFSQVLEALSHFVAEQRYGGGTSLRLTLTGEVSSDVIIPTSTIEEKISGPGYVEVIDKTSPMLDCDELEGDLTIRGAFYAQLKPMLNSENDDERCLAQQALRLGLEYLKKM